MHLGRVFYTLHTYCCWIIAPFHRATCDRDIIDRDEPARVVNMHASPIFNRRYTRNDDPRTPLHARSLNIIVEDAAASSCVVKTNDTPQCVDQPTLIQLPTEVIVHICTIDNILTASDWACVQATCAHLRQVVHAQRIPSSITIDARCIFSSPHAVPALVTPTTALTPTQRAASLCRWLATHQSAMRHVTLLNHQGDGDHGPAEEQLYGGSPSFAAYFSQQAPPSGTRRRNDPLTQPCIAALGPLTWLTLHNTPCSRSMAAALGARLSTTLQRLTVSCDRSYRGRRASLQAIVPLLNACTQLQRLEWTGVRMAWLGSTLAPQQHTRATAVHLDQPSIATLTMDDAYMALGGGSLPLGLSELRFR